MELMCEDTTKLLSSVRTASHSPSWPGGASAPTKENREASLAAQTGWWFKADLIPNASSRSVAKQPSLLGSFSSVLNHHPACGVAAACPSWPGGAMAVMALSH